MKKMFKCLEHNTYISFWHTGKHSFWQINVRPYTIISWFQACVSVNSTCHAACFSASAWKTWAIVTLPTSSTYSYFVHINGYWGTPSIYTYSLVNEFLAGTQKSPCFINFSDIMTYCFWFHVPLRAVTSHHKYHATVLPINGCMNIIFYTAFIIFATDQFHYIQRKCCKPFGRVNLKFQWAKKVFELWVCGW